MMVDLQNTDHRANRGGVLGDNSYRRGRGLPFSLKLLVLAFLPAAIAVTLLCHLLSFLIKLDLGVREAGRGRKSNIRASAGSDFGKSFLPGL